MQEDGFRTCYISLTLCAPYSACAHAFSMLWACAMGSTFGARVANADLTLSLFRWTLLCRTGSAGSTRTRQLQSSAHQRRTAQQRERQGKGPGIRFLLPSTTNGSKQEEHVYRTRFAAHNWSRVYPRRPCRRTTHSLRNGRFVEHLRLHGSLWCCAKKPA